MRTAILIPAIVLAVLLLHACETRRNADTVPTTGTDTTSDVAYSFAVIGCNRIDYTDTSASNPSTANLVQLRRTFQEIAALDPKPAMLFFTGDLVLGLTRDTARLAAELEAWLAVYKESPLASSGIRLIALPGNHEALYLNRSLTEIPDPGFERVWLRLMAPYIAGSNGPGPGGPDHLTTDQSRLTYSFEYRDSHFVIANTDTYDSASTLPVNWIAADVAAARADSGVKHIFLLGHKPAYPSPLDDEKDCLNRYPAMRNQLWSALEGSRCEAMLAAHNHLYYKVRPDSGKTWQVIAGNGGSSLIRGLDAGDRFFGFSVVTVTRGGRVYLKSMGRDEPAAGYMAPCPASQYPTTLRDSVELTWGM